MPFSKLPNTNTKHHPHASAAVVFERGEWYRSSAGASDRQPCHSPVACPLTCTRTPSALTLTPLRCQTAHTNRCRVITAADACTAAEQAEIDEVEGGMYRREDMLQKLEETSVQPEGGDGDSSDDGGDGDSSDSEIDLDGL